MPGAKRPQRLTVQRRDRGHHEPEGGVAAEGIAVLIGIAAAYLGGLWDGSLSVLTDVLLVIPLFPLLIVIAAYAHGGLGDPNTVSWGTTLYWAQNNAALQTGEPLWAIAPGACIAVLGAALALLNYAFDEIGNPALRPVRKVRPKKGAQGKDAREKGAEQGA